MVEPTRDSKRVSAASPLPERISAIVISSSSFSSGQVVSLKDSKAKMISFLWQQELRRKDKAEKRQREEEEQKKHEAQLKKYDGI